MPTTTIKVEKAYVTRTPFPYCELRGRFAHQDIVIGVTLYAAGESASISGVLCKGTVQEDVVEKDGERALLNTIVRDVTAWHARLRTDVETLEALVDGTSLEGDGLELSWDNAPNPKECKFETFFGTQPTIGVVDNTCR